MIDNTLQLSEQLTFQELLKSPYLPFYAQQIKEVLAAESQRRQAFYARITEQDKAEFINGEVIYHSPVRLRHNMAGGNLYRLLSSYVMSHNLGFVGYEKLMVSLTRNDYEPDICFFKQETANQFKPDQMHFPAPDLAVEVLSDSTAANDRGVKFQDYAAHGVAEYWIIDPELETVEQYQLVGKTYQLVIKARSGELESLVVEGFIIPIAAIFDEQVNGAVLRQLLGSA